MSFIRISLLFFLISCSSKNLSHSPASDFDGDEKTEFNEDRFLKSGYRF